MILALELGGNNPLVVWDAVDAEAAAALVVQSAFITTGPLPKELSDFGKIPPVPLLVVPPPWVFVPVRVRPPAPDLSRATVPLVFRMVPLKTLVVPSMPTVRVAAPPADVLSTMPPPFKPLMSCDVPFRSSVPFNIRSPAVNPLESTLGASVFRVPMTVVSPEWVAVAPNSTVPVPATMKGKLPERNLRNLFAPL